MSYSQQFNSCEQIQKHSQTLPEMQSNNLDDRDRQADEKRSLDLENRIKFELVCHYLDQNDQQNLIKMEDTGHQEMSWIYIPKDSLMQEIFEFIQKSFGNLFALVTIESIEHRQKTILNKNQIEKNLQEKISKYFQEKSGQIYVIIKQTQGNM